MVYKAVSIPNGMEFYAANSGGWNFLDMRFNSQRDGILPQKWCMTSTSIICFNSQRDGILLKFKHFTSFQMKFQFPTGWNSTNAVAISQNQRKGFNSQRDGILRFAYYDTGAAI